MIPVSIKSHHVDCIVSIDQPQYPPQSSPSPNFQRPGPSNPAPFYVAGAEVPSQGQPQSQPPPQQQQQYPHRDPTPRIPSAGKQPEPINTSSPPPQANAYAPYGQKNQRPQSTYGAQELATSVYDSPIAPHNPNSAATYSSSVYSPDEQFAHASQAQGQGQPPTHGSSVVPPPSAYTPQQPPNQPSQPQYQSYQPPSAPPGHDAYGGGAPSHAPPPVPTGAAPSAPPGADRPGVLTPPPLQPGGPAYDARQGLPSQVGGPSGPPQYKAYVPPGAPPAGDGPSAPAPSDYYRQSGVY